MLVELLRRAFKRRGTAASAASTDPSIDASGSAATPADLVDSAIEQARRGDATQAERLLARALELDANQAAAHDALGNVLRTQERLDAALASFQRALRLEPQRVSALSNMGLCLRDLGRYDEARALLERATRLDPAEPTIATNLAALLFDMGHFDAGRTLAERILEQHPDFSEAHVVRGTRLLRRGDFAQGWDEYEWRDRTTGREVPAAFDYPQWDGRPIAQGCLLVCCEQGLGDQIMFASCFDDLLRVAPNCVIECDARLKALFARSFPQARFYVMRKRVEEMWLRDGLNPIARTWMGSLPRRYRREAADFPQRAHYLRADPAKAERWAHALQALGSGPKIGISWRGGVWSTRRSLRSIALDAWMPLLRSPELHFISLQYGACSDEIDRVRASAGVTLTHWDAAIRDLSETAALISALDLVISVQTTVVHLAGALGKPVWILVPSVAEWRYGERGESMLWYSSARLFRQERSGDWSRVFDDVIAAAHSLY